MLNQKFCKAIKNYDIIIPVPISKKRYKERGYNQSALIAKEIVRQFKSKSKNQIEKKMNLEYNDNCLFKKKNIVEQSKLNRQERQKNIQGVYELKNKKKLVNKKILLVDDIYTTGSTVNECCKVLSQALPQKIGVLTIAKD